MNSLSFIRPSPPATCSATAHPLQGTLLHSGRDLFFLLLKDGRHDEKPAPRLEERRPGDPLLPETTQLPQVGSFDLVQPFFRQLQPELLQILEILNHLRGELDIFP